MLNVEESWIKVQVKLLKRLNIYAYFIIDFQSYSGFFSSPSKNGLTYRSNSKCNWLIRAQTNQIIKLTFNTFSIEKHSTCKFDYVKVLDSDFNEIGKFCGNEHPPLIQSMTNELIVQFASDKSTELEGFSASFVFTDSSTTCGGHLAQAAGKNRKLN